MTLPALGQTRTKTFVSKFDNGIEVYKMMAVNWLGYFGLMKINPFEIHILPIT